MENQLKKAIIFFFLLANIGYMANAQNASESEQQKAGSPAADDPSQFFTRVELFNELQYYEKNDYYFNQTTLRTTIKIGKRFTTRFDIPYIYNSLSRGGYQKSGIGDISFRLLGYKFLEKPKSAITASMEVSLNTAQTPLMGTGKNLIIPLLSYSQVVPQKRLIIAAVFQQAISVSGDETRSDVSFSKIQVGVIKSWSKKMWAYVAPELFIDYVKGGSSMNVDARFVRAVAPRVNIWVGGGAGIYGDFIGRYQWTAEVGYRYFLIRNKAPQKK